MSVETVVADAVGEWDHKLQQQAEESKTEQSVWDASDNDTRQRESRAPEQHKAVDGGRGETHTTNQSPFCLSFQTSKRVFAEFNVILV